MIINPFGGTFKDSIPYTTNFLKNKKILVCFGNRLALTACVMTPSIQQSLIGGTTTEDEALVIQMDKNPDLLIVTEFLERGYGIRLVEKAKKINPNIKALIFLDRETPEVVQEAMEAGADGVMFTSSIGTGHGDFIKALKTTSEGGIYYPNKIRDICCKESKPTPILIDPLSDRELEVINCLVHGMKNTEIAKALSISTETVKSHVSTTIHKLGVRDRTQAVVFALTNGFIKV